MKRLFKRIWHRLPLYSKIRLDEEWLEGFFRGLKNGREETGVIRDHTGKFRRAE